MTTRQEAHDAVDQLFDRLEAGGRTVIGIGVAVSHSGMHEGSTTIEAAVGVRHRARCVVPLLGAIGMLEASVIQRTTWTDVDATESTS